MLPAETVSQLPSAKQARYLSLHLQTTGGPEAASCFLALEPQDVVSILNATFQILQMQHRKPPINTTLANGLLHTISSYALSKDELPSPVAVRLVSMAEEINDILTDTNNFTSLHPFASLVKHADAEATKAFCQAAVIIGRSGVEVRAKDNRVSLAPSSSISAIYHAVASKYPHESDADKRNAIRTALNQSCWQPLVQRDEEGQIIKYLELGESAHPSLLKDLTEALKARDRGYIIGAKLTEALAVTYNQVGRRLKQTPAMTTESRQLSETHDNLTNLLGRNSAGRRSLDTAIG